MSIETQAIQVAAAAVALVEDCQRPASPRGQPAEGRAARKWWDPGEMVLGMVRDERKRQAGKRGDRRHLPLEWLMVLAAEVGELADAVTASTPPDGPALAVCDDLKRAAAAARRWLEEQPGSLPSAT
jgi:hypothetical protein